MDRPARILLTGKGGTGKTTAAAALALGLAARGIPVLVASLDPAHNLGDVLGVDLGDTPREAAPGVLAREVDLGRLVRQHLAATRQALEERYRYLSAANLDPLLRLLGEAPGAEEQAAAEALARLDRDAVAAGRVLVVDLPPSGQAWRILALPSATAAWLAGLADLRRRILDRRKTLHHVLGQETPARLPGGGDPAPADPEQDPVTARIAEGLSWHRRLARALSDPAATRLLAVADPGALSLLEADRLAAQVGRRGISLAGLVLNRVREGTPAPGPDRLPEALWNLPRAVLPELPGEPRGEASLAPLAGPLLALLRFPGAGPMV